MTTICILNWQNWSETVNCIASVFEQSQVVDQLIVVENGSTNDSLQRIADWLIRNVPRIGGRFFQVDVANLSNNRLAEICATSAPRVVLVSSETNKGFSGGFNLALELVSQLPDAEFVVLLNSDVLLPNDFTKTLIQRATLYPDDIGLLGPLVLDRHDGTDWQRPERFRPSVWLLPLRAFLIRRARKTRGKWSILYRRYWYTGPSPSSVFMVHGCCLILTRQLLEHYPRLDENLFLYWEEATLADYVMQKGLRVWFDPSLIVRHGWGESTTKSLKDAHLAKSTRYYFESVRKVGGIAKVFLRFYLWALGVARRIFSA